MVKIKNTETTDTDVSNRELIVHALIKRRSLYAAGAGLIPIPVLDIATILGVQVAMIKDISVHYGFEEDLDSKKIKHFIHVIAGNLGAAGVLSAVKAVPLAGSAIGILSVPITASAATYALGKVFSLHFAHGGTLLDFNPEDAREYFKDEYEAGRLLMKNNGHQDTGTKEVTKNEKKKKNMVVKKEPLSAEDTTSSSKVASKVKQKTRMKDAITNDFTIIKGIGPKSDALLKAAGIGKMTELSEATEEQLREIMKTEESKFNFINPSSWPEQAGLIAAGKMGELKKLQDELAKRRQK